VFKTYCGLSSGRVVQSAREYRGKELKGRAEEVGIDMTLFCCLLSASDAYISMDESRNV
jgi:hypothetical protein